MQLENAVSRCESIDVGGTALPLVSHRSEPSPACPPSLGIAPAEAHVAIIDDEPLNIKVVQKYLKLAGYQRFTTSTDATGALELIRQARPDAVLLDIMMPHVSGLQILEQLRADSEQADVPVVILTAASDRETKLAALNLGATEFLPKPVDSLELEVRLRNVLRVRAHQNHLKRYAFDLEQEVSLRTAELAEAHVEVAQCLARAGEYRDNDTGRHVIRVGRYAGIIARRLGCDPSFVRRIRLAAPLHDIGKIGIPDAILLKPAKLNEMEMDQIRRHCNFGLDMCTAEVDDDVEEFRSHTVKGRKIAEFGRSPILKMAAIIAHTHHEKWDGTGYPRGLAGEAIPLVGRITAIADVFDALLSPRPYKPAFSLEKALDILRDGRGTHFDPTVLDAFFDSLDEIVQVSQTYADELAGRVDA
jgi:putative two-component system response regulator